MHESHLPPPPLPPLPRPRPSFQKHWLVWGCIAAVAAVVSQVQAHAELNQRSFVDRPWTSADTIDLIFIAGMSAVISGAIFGAVSYAVACIIHWVRS